MFIKLKNRLKSIITIYPSFINTVQKILGVLVALVVVLGFLQSKNINVFQILGQIIQTIISILQFKNVPLIIWIISIVFFGFLFFLWRRVNLVAGEFREEFKNGLSKWEFGQDGWMIEQEGKESVLSVSNSREGGITKKGFSWSDYEFSFETKVISYCSGWIIRAENRSKYLMIQLNMENINDQKLRLHLKVPGSDYAWVVMPEIKLNLNNPLKMLEWIKVRIVVLGSNIDVYLNKEQAAHYSISDPLSVPTEESVLLENLKTKLSEEVKIKRNYTAMDYSVGRVGFRCAPPNEHAHFRNIIVKPIF